MMYTRRSRAEPFGNETPLPPPLSTSAFDSASFLSDDGRVLICMTLDKRPYECRFHVRASPDAPFGPPQSMGPVHGTAIEIGHPWLSPDGERMYFHTRDLPGGHGDLDLWMTRRVPRSR